MKLIFFACILAMTSAQDMRFFDDWISQSDRQFSRLVDQSGVPGSGSQSRSAANVPETQDLSLLEDQLANNWNNLERVQSRKQDSIHKIDIQLQQSQKSALGQQSLSQTKLVTTTEDTVAPALRSSELPPGLKHSKRHSKRTSATTTTTTAASFLVNEEDEIADEKPESDVSTSSPTSTKPLTASTTSPKTSATAAPVELVDKPLTLLITGRADRSQENAELSVEAQLQENWKKIEHFQALRKIRLFTTTDLSTTSIVSQSDTVLKVRDDSEVEDLEEPSIKMPHKAEPFKKVTLAESTPVKKNQTAQVERIETVLLTIRSPAQDKIMSMSKWATVSKSTQAPELNSPSAEIIDVPVNDDEYEKLEQNISSTAATTELRTTVSIDLSGNTKKTTAQSNSSSRRNLVTSPTASHLLKASDDENTDSEDGDSEANNDEELSTSSSTLLSSQTQSSKKVTTTQSKNNVLLMKESEGQPKVILAATLQLKPSGASNSLGNTTTSRQNLIKGSSKSSDAGISIDPKETEDDETEEAESSSSSLAR